MKKLFAVTMINAAIWALVVTIVVSHMVDAWMDYKGF